MTQQINPLTHNKTLLIATHNQAKLAEIKRLLGDIPYAVVSLTDLGIEDDVDETGKTFEENALLKAQAYCAMTKLPTLADDSGLEVVALNGEPGIYTNRYAGPHATEEEKRQFLLTKMKDIPLNKRQAQFTVVMVLVWPSGEVMFAQSAYKGFISTDISGTPIAHFPYRSIFVPEGSERTLAELIERGEAIKSPRDEVVAEIREKLLKK
jgi:XTP/dITP diphosphohydrolase